MREAWTRNEVTHDWVLSAPHRRQRPQGPGLIACPFCPGQEMQTPPTTEALPASSAWSTRAFPNPYPLTSFHELVVDARRHASTLHELTDAEVTLAVELWTRRLRAARAEHTYPFLYRNDGPASGASIPHTHAHVVGTRVPLPRLVEETRAFSGPCPLERSENWQSKTRHGVLVVGTPRAARFPSETWVLPVRHAPRFEDEDDATRAAFARALMHATRGVAERGIPAYNVVLHTAPTDAASFHWHAEILPRRDPLAGFELGAGAFVNAGP